MCIRDRATGLCGLLPRWRCAYRGYGFVRSASPVALRLPGLRVCAVCFPGGAALTGATGCLLYTSDPDNFAGTLLSCDNIKTGSNVARWCDKSYDALVKKAILVLSLIHIWDNEKVNLLPGYDPEYMKASAELQAQTRADKIVAIKA